ncbi:Hypp6839 [Branchiostoma lanceolatum]|uniref:Hypp6839 protein n=1 Tax=Branchiostoma lanceolatum TaxID=7740 RepID=A0A8J9YVM5_BRALA|nr:Hypp6839 [Branchiostoma lanceolatum]
MEMPPSVYIAFIYSCPEFVDAYWLEGELGNLRLQGSTVEPSTLLWQCPEKVSNSEEEICQEVRESRGTTFTKTEAEDDVDFESSPPPVPSSAEVSTALDVLLRCMQCHDDSEYSHFARIEGIVQEINQQRQGVEKA